MARKTKQVVSVSPKADWYLQEWMETLRVSQAKLASECDWSRGTMHGIYHGRTEYYRELVNLIADKLKIEPFELLMRPDRAMAMRRFRETAANVVQSEERVASSDARAERVGTGTAG